MLSSLQFTQNCAVKYIVNIAAVWFLHFPTLSTNNCLIIGMHSVSCVVKNMWILSIICIVGCGTAWAAFDLENTYFLEDKCEQTLKLPCPKAASKFKDGYAGQFRYWRLPLEPCRVTVVLSGCFPTSDFKIALYVNIRESFTRDNDTIRVSDDKNTVPTKTIPGGKLPNPASSAGQFRTGFSVKPTLIFSYKPARDAITASSNRDHQVVMDYTVVKSDHKTEHFGDFYYCDALDGYVHRDIFCMRNRITCPNNFSASVDQANSATAKQDRDFCSGPAGSVTKPRPTSTTTTPKPLTTTPAQTTTLRTAQLTANVTGPTFRPSGAAEEPASFRLHEYNSAESLVRVHHDSDLKTNLPDGLPEKGVKGRSNDTCQGTVPLIVDCRGDKIQLNRNVTEEDDPSTIVVTRDGSQLCRQLMADMAELITFRSRTRN